MRLLQVKRGFDALDDLSGGQFGLDDIAVNAEGVDAFGRFFRTKVGEDDYWNRLAPILVPDLFQGFFAGHFRHLHVKQDNVRLERLGQRNAAGAVIGQLNFEAFGFELHAVHLTDGRVVFDDGDFSHKLSILQTSLAVW